jgi:hypothetical protein
MMYLARFNMGRPLYLFEQALWLVDYDNKI